MKETFDSKFKTTENLRYALKLIEETRRQRI